MKYILIFGICICAFTTSSAQKSETTKTPQIITKLPYNQELNFDGTKLKFIDVLEDSRCPTNDNCFWEGQIKVNIGIYKEQKLVEEKEITFLGKGNDLDHPKLLFKTNKKNIYGYRVNPYPRSQTKIPKKEYYIELIVK